MTKKVGRFKIRDNERSVRRCADHEEEFMARLHGEGDEQTEEERDEEERERFRRGEHIGAPSEDGLSPIEQFKHASDRKNNIGRAANCNRNSDSDAKTPIRRFVKASNSRHGLRQ